MRRVRAPRGREAGGAEACIVEAASSRTWSKCRCRDVARGDRRQDTCRSGPRSRSGARTRPTKWLGTGGSGRVLTVYSSPMPIETAGTSLALNAVKLAYELWKDGKTEALALSEGAKTVLASMQTDPTDNGVFINAPGARDTACSLLCLYHPDIKIRTTRRVLAELEAKGLVATFREDGGTSQLEHVKLTHCRLSATPSRNRSNASDSRAFNCSVAVAGIGIEQHRAEPAVAVNNPIDGVALRLEHVVEAVFDQLAIAVEELAVTCRRLLTPGRGGGAETTVVSLSPEMVGLRFTAGGAGRGRREPGDRAFGPGRTGVGAKRAGAISPNAVLWARYL